jgi:hypothetical protein
MRNIASTESSNVLGILCDNRKKNEVLRKVRASYNVPYYMYPKHGNPMDVQEKNVQKTKTFYDLSLQEVMDILDRNCNVHEPEKATVMEMVSSKDIKIKGQRGKEEGNLFYKCASDNTIGTKIFLDMTSKDALKETVPGRYVGEYSGWNSKSVLIASEYQYDGQYASDSTYDKELLKYKPSKTSFISDIATAYLQQNTDKLRGHVYIAPFDTDTVNFVPFKNR